MPTDLPRVLTTATGRTLGVGRAATRHQVERGRWCVLAPGLVLTAPGPPTREDWVLAGLALATPRAALSGWDAVRAFGVGARTPPAGVLILDRAGRHRRVGDAWIRPTDRPYRLSMLPGDHPALPFVPVVHPARAVADTAILHHTLAPVRAMVTSSVQRHVCTPDELELEYGTAPRNGSALLRRALSDVLDGAQSIAEAEAVAALNRGRVASFEVNVPIVTAAGHVIAVADVLWRGLRAVLEIDSREFHFSEQDWQASMARHNLLSRHSLAVTHYPPSAVRGRLGGRGHAVASGPGRRAGPRVRPGRRGAASRPGRLRAVRGHVINSSWWLPWPPRSAVDQPTDARKQGGRAAGGRATGGRAAGRVTGGARTHDRPRPERARPVRRGAERD